MAFGSRPRRVVRNKPNRKAIRRRTDGPTDRIKELIAVEVIHLGVRGHGLDRRKRFNVAAVAREEWRPQSIIHQASTLRADAAWIRSRNLSPIGDV